VGVLPCPGTQSITVDVLRDKNINLFLPPDGNIEDVFDLQEVEVLELVR
jgi:hypothetical protein